MLSLGALLVPSGWGSPEGLGWRQDKGEEAQLLFPRAFSLHAEADPDCL